jgi:hypothetical protein
VGMSRFPGCRRFSHGEAQVEEGRAFLFFWGNGGDGLVRLPRQARADDSAPIPLLGTSDSESAFRIKAFGRTAAGRGRVRLQFEVKPANTPFDGSGIETTPPVDTGMPTGDGSAVPLTELANGLTAATLYHWRLRIDADSSFFPHSPWFTLAVLADGAQEARRHDLRWGGSRRRERPASITGRLASPDGLRYPSRLLCCEWQRNGPVQRRESCAFLL